MTTQQNPVKKIRKGMKRYDDLPRDLKLVYMNSVGFTPESEDSAQTRKLFFDYLYEKQLTQKFIDDFSEKITMAGLEPNDPVKLTPDQNYQIEKAKKILFTASYYIDEVNNDIGSGVLGLQSHKLDQIRADLDKFQKLRQ